MGLAYVYLPFMILPIEARLSAADPALGQAAADLGAPPWRVFRHVTLPLSLPKGLPQTFEVRGEVFMSKAGFAKLNEEREGAGEGESVGA
jgi:ABC-type uncharacterized transport system permease subunit